MGEEVGEGVAVGVWGIRLVKVRWGREMVEGEDEPCSEVVSFSSSEEGAYNSQGLSSELAASRVEASVKSLMMTQPSCSRAVMRSFAGALASIRCMWRLLLLLLLLTTCSCGVSSGDVDLAWLLWL